MSDQLIALGAYLKPKDFWWGLVQTGHLAGPGALLRKEK